MPEVTVHLERTGFVDLDGGADAGAIGCILMIAGLVVGFLVHLIVFRGGWTMYVYVDDQMASKIRYRSKSAAVADTERQKALALQDPPPPPPPPVRLPTRGKTFRRPW
jgi:hypothetical protein